MAKQKIILIVATASIIAILVIILLNNQGRNEPSKINNDDTATKQEKLTNEYIHIFNIDKKDEHNKKVRSEIIQGNYGKIDSIGIRNNIPSDYNDSSPLIELRFFEKQIDDNLIPLYLNEFSVDSNRPKGEMMSGGSGYIRGYGIRFGLEIADKLDGGCDLQWDTEYIAYGSYHLSGDPNNIYRGRTSKLSFRTPKSLGPGEIYRVDLVLVDRIKEQQEKDLVRIAKEEIARIEKEETITFQISEFPKYDESFMWSARYHDGNIDREFTRNDSSFILKGPNKLGGELVILYFTREVTHVWLYVSNVQKRILNLPEGGIKGVRYFFKE